MRSRSHLVAISLAAVALAACSVDAVTFTLGEGQLAEDCSAAGDEDGNDLADCMDPACAGAPSCPPPCGNGIVDPGEQCDDGNIASGDGCDATCHAEPFTTTAPVRISGGLSCTTAFANTGRKISIDGGGTVYAVMTCGRSADVAVSTDRGRTFSAPRDLSTGLSTMDPQAGVSQVAVATGPGGVAYVGIILSTGEVFLRTTQDKGATWGAAVAIGTALTPASGLSLLSFNDDIYVGFSIGSGVSVARNHTKGVGTFDLTPVPMSVVFFDLLYDVTSGKLAVCTDDPSFHVRISSNAGASFAAEVNPPGMEHFSDWAIGNGKIFVSGSGTTLSSVTGLFVIPINNPSTSIFVGGLPVSSTPQTRSVAADAAGNAFVASQLDSAGVQLQRLVFGAPAFEPPRWSAPAGTSPSVAPLPGNQGAAVVYTIGPDVWATIQAY